MASEYGREIKLIRTLENDNLKLTQEGDRITLRHKMPPQDTSHTYVSTPPIAHLDVRYVEMYRDIFADLCRVIELEEDDYPAPF